MTETGAGPGESDALLADALRNQGEGASSALDILYRRHWKAVLAYARTCCRDLYTAEDLASESFTRTLEAVHAGGGPDEAWRPYLLAVVRRTAADWSRTERRTELAPDFERWLDRTAPEETAEERLLRKEDGGMVRTAFRSLPERWQAVLWHTEVEGEAADRVAPLLGIGVSGVGSLASRAREGLREAYLSAHAEGADAGCLPYASIMGAEIRRGGRRPKRMLKRHLSECIRCRAAFSDLTGMNKRMRTVLPAAVLLWMGPFAGSTGLQAAMGAAGGTAGAVGSAVVMSKAPTAAAPLVAGAAAVGTAGVIGGAAVLSGVPVPEAPPAAAPPSAVATAADPAPEEGPRPSPGTAPVDADPPPPETVAGEQSRSPEAEPSRAGDDLGPSAGETRLMNAAGGTCVLPDGDRAVLGPCDGGEDEVWEVFDSAPDDDRTWLRHAESGGCLDYGDRGNGGGALTLGPCRADREGQMFRFAMHPDGSCDVFADAAVIGGPVLLIGIEAPDGGDHDGPDHDRWSGGDDGTRLGDGSALVAIGRGADAVGLRFRITE